jgi:hypothetical protein
MLTVIETPTFQRIAADIWSEAGDGIKGTGGLRKVREALDG